MLPNYARWSGLESYQRGVSNLDRILLVKMVEKPFEKSIEWESL